MAYDMALAAIAGGITGIISLLILDRNWYRRETFKLKRDNMKAENQLQIKKMARDLGLDKKVVQPIPPTSSSGIDTLRSLAPLLQKLAPEDIQDILGIVTGQETAESGEGTLGGLNGIDGLIDFATKNPEIVKGFLGGLKGGTQKTDELPSQI